MEEDDEEKEKCEILARNLINSGENVIDVSITDIKSHSKSLMNSINALDYKEALPHLCNTNKTFVKMKIDPEESVKNLLVRLII